MKRYLSFLVPIFLFAYVVPLSAQSCDPAAMYTYQDIWFDSDPAGYPLIVGENLTSSCNSGVAAYADASFAMPSGRMTNGAVTYNYGVADAIASAYLEWSDGTVESGEAVFSGSNLLNVPTACFSIGKLFRLAHTSFGPPPIVEPGGSSCVYTTLACSTGRPTCPAALPGVLFSEGCPNYIQTTYLVIDGVCVSPGLERAKSRPAPCD